MNLDCILQPLLTTDAHKQCKTPQAKPFYELDDIRLKYFEETADWLQDDWHGGLVEEQKIDEVRSLLINLKIIHECEQQQSCLSLTFFLFINSNQITMNVLMMRIMPPLICQTQNMKMR